MNRLLTGALAGVVATAPMTVVMEILHRWPRPESEPLPPHQITLEIAEQAGVKPHLDEPSERIATILVSHFGYGAGAGALYAPLAARVPGHPAVKGAAFGLLVWALSYLGWLPAAGILPPATENTPRRNALMITAHLVWGATTGLLAERWKADEAGT